MVQTLNRLRAQTGWMMDTRSIREGLVRHYRNELRRIASLTLGTAAQRAELYEAAVAKLETALNELSGREAAFVAEMDRLRAELRARVSECSSVQR